MTCPRCRRETPERKLSCPYCLEADSRTGTLDLQYSHIDRVLSEELLLNVCNPGNGKVHIALFGVGDRSFCWVRLPGVQRTRFQLLYRDADRRVTCLDCRRQLNGLVARYRKEKALP